MATETKINDIASQLNTASRLVVSTDFFWIYTANGSQVKIPAEFVRAYLVNGIKPSINANGNWQIDGKDLGVVAKGKTPQFRGGAMGIEVSYDEGKTWKQAVAYTDMDPDLAPLAEAYTKVTQGEADRQKAENTRNSNETTRQNQETARVEAEKNRVTAENGRADAETTRNGNESTRKTQETARQNQEANRQNAETQRAKAETTRNSNETARKAAETQRQKDTSAAISNSKTQTDLAKELNDHPPKMGENGNWWQWNLSKHEYVDTGVIARGGAMYPSFRQHRNKLLMIDYGSHVAEHVVKRRNKLIIKV